MPENEEAANFYRERLVADKAKPITYSWQPKSKFLTYEELSQRLREIVLTKEERHHIGEEGFVQPDRTMSYIGG